MNSCVAVGKANSKAKKNFFLQYLIVNNYFTVAEAVVVLGEGTKVKTSIEYYKYQKNI